jgi:hypothetical protein
MAVQRGVLTPWKLKSSGRTFVVADGPEYPCYQDLFGSWWCGHEHYRDSPLEEIYEFTPGWTAQVRSPDEEEDLLPLQSEGFALRLGDLPTA